MVVRLAYWCFHRAANAAIQRRRAWMARLDHKVELDTDQEHLVLLSVVGIGPEASTSDRLLSRATSVSSPATLATQIHATTTDSQLF